MAISINREGYFYIVSFSLLGILTSYFSLIAAFCLFILTIFFIWFFRDPSRIIPKGKNVIVSPADGTLKWIKKGKENILHIVISPFDVHINRAPISGKITRIKGEGGKHKPAYSNKSYENVRNSIEINFGKRKITVTQIVGFFARRLRCWVNKGDRIEIGQRIGMIKFGSGTELVLPKDVKILVKEGSRMRGGETVIGKITN